VLAELWCDAQVISFKEAFLRIDLELAAKRSSARRGPKSMLPSACEFAKDELLSQTADDMQTHVYSKSLEYMRGRTRRSGVVSS